MINTNKYKKFFDKAEIPIEFEEEFNENTKNGVCKLLKNNVKILTEKEWDKYLKKYKYDECIKVAALRSEFVSTDVKNLILNRELELPSNQRSHYVLTELLKRPIKTEGIVLELALKIGTENIKNEYKQAFKDGRLPNISMEVTDILNKHLWKELDGTSLSCYPLSNGILENIKASAKTSGKAPSENVILGIINNVSLTYNIRNEWFENYPCDITKIKSPTPYMVAQIYNSCAETIFEVPYSELFNNETRDKELKRIKEIMIYLIKEHDLRPDLQRDLLCRLMMVSEKEKQPYITEIMNALATYSEEPDILTSLSSLDEKTFSNPFLPEEVAKEKADKVTEILCKPTTKKRDDEQKRTIIRYYANHLKFGEENGKKIMEHNSPEVYSAFAEYYYAPDNILQELSKKENVNNISPLSVDGMKAYLMYHFRNVKFKKEVAEYLVSNLFYANNLMFKNRIIKDMGIQLDVFEMDKLFTIIKNGEREFKDKNFILTNYKTHIQRAYTIRDLYYDYPSFYQNSFDINQNKEKERQILKKDFNKKILSRIDGTLNLHFYVTAVSDWYETLNYTKDKVKFYEVIDDGIEVVQEIKKLDDKKREKELARDIFSIGI